MRCPFPGMDPYIERAEIWPDFHDRLVTYVCAALQPVLRPRYLAIMQHRLYVVETDHPTRPDVAVVRASTSKGTAASTAMLESDSPAVFEIWREELREPVIQIVEPSMGNRVVTAVEILGPANKSAGPGRESYLKKREEFWSCGVNLVEIDLLRDGEPTVRVPLERLSTLSAWRYLVAVTRRFPSRHEVYAVPLNQRLPRAAIPLASGDADIALDLQAAFTRCWEAGPYPELLNYGGPPPGQLTDEESRWCAEMLQKSNFS